MSKRELRRATIGSMLAVTTVAVLAACGSSSPSDAAGGGSSGKTLEKVTLIEGAHVIGYSPIYLALKKGYFADEGLEVNLVTAKSSSEATAAVVGGSALAGLSAATDALNAIHGGAKLKLVYAIDDQWGLVLTVSNKYAEEHHLTANMPLSEKVKALKGAKIGVSAAGSATELAVRVMLEEAGLNPEKDVTIVAVGSAPAAALSSLKNGAIDAFMFSPPFGNMAESEGIGKQMINMNTGEVPAFDNALFQGLIVNNSSLSEHHKQIIEIGKALARAEQEIASDPEGAGKAVSGSFEGIPPSIVESAFKTTQPSFVKAPTPISASSVQKDIEVLGLQSSLKPQQAIEPINPGTGGA